MHPSQQTLRNCNHCIVTALEEGEFELLSCIPRLSALAGYTAQPSSSRPSGHMEIDLDDTLGILPLSHAGSARIAPNAVTSDLWKPWWWTCYKPSGPYSLTSNLCLATYSWSSQPEHVVCCCDHEGLEYLWQSSDTGGNLYNMRARSLALQDDERLLRFDADKLTRVHIWFGICHRVTEVVLQCLPSSSTLPCYRPMNRCDREPASVRNAQHHRYRASVRLHPGRQPVRNMCPDMSAQPAYAETKLIRGERYIQHAYSLHEASWRAPSPSGILLYHWPQSTFHLDYLTTWLPIVSLHITRWTLTPHQRQTNEPKKHSSKYAPVANLLTSDCTTVILIYDTIRAT